MDIIPLTNRKTIHPMCKYIVYIGGFVLPDKNAAAHRVINNAKLLRLIGYDVVFIGTSESISKDSILKTKEIVYDFLAYTENYPSSLLQWINHLSATRNVKIIIDQLGKENVAAIIAYNYPSIALQRLKKYCHKNKIRIIADCTEWSVDRLSSPIRGLVKNLDTYYRMHFVHPKLDGLIVISKYLYNFYITKTDKIFLLPPLVDTSEEKWNRKQSITDGCLKIVYAGSPGNGLKDRLDIIINSLTMIESKLSFPIKLIIIGLSKEQYLTSFKLKAIPESINNIIEFKGRLSHLESLDEIKKAHFTIFLRIDNLITRAGFPTKFVESITCGTPVLTNSTSNIIDFLNDVNFGFLLKLDSTLKLNKALIEAISTPMKQINEMKAICYHSKIFDISNYKDVFNNFLKEVIRNN